MIPMTVSVHLARWVEEAMANVFNSPVRPSAMHKRVKKGSQEHPGFKAVAAKIGRERGIRNPGAVLAAASRKASPAAKKANPRLKRVKG